MNFTTTIAQLRAGRTYHRAPRIPESLMRVSLGQAMKQFAQVCTITPLASSADAFPTKLPCIGTPCQNDYGLHLGRLPWVHGYKLTMNDTLLTLSLVSRDERDESYESHLMATHWIQPQSSSAMRGTELVKAFIDLIPHLYAEPVEYPSTVQLVKLMHGVGNHLNDFELWLNADGLYATAGRGRDGVYGCRVRTHWPAEMA